MVWIVQNPNTGGIIKVCSCRTKALFYKRVAQKNLGVLLTVEKWKVC